MKNDNLDIFLSIGGYHISILKFSYECMKNSMPAHSHSSNSYEIHYIPRGKGTLLSQQKTYPMYPGILCTTGPHVEHAQVPDSRDPMYEYCIYLKIEKTSRHGADPKSGRTVGQFLRFPFWYGRDSAGMEPILEQIHRELSESRPGAELMLQALFMQFMVCMLRNYDHRAGTAVSSETTPQNKAYIIIEDSFLYEYATITLAELSARLGLSTRQTGRILFRQYGMSFTEKKTEARMAAAENYLRENRLTVSEISDRLGYSCTNHFHAAFKKYYHVTASEYRSRMEAESR